jgi:PiT family inorganic phosphate transporter
MGIIVVLLYPRGMLDGEFHVSFWVVSTFQAAIALGTLFMAIGLGIPVSTTHTITGAIVGVGAAKRVSAVRWNVARSIVTACFITMPPAAAIAAVFYFVGGLFLT